MSCQKRSAGRASLRAASRCAADVPPANSPAAEPNHRKSSPPLQQHQTRRAGSSFLSHQPSYFLYFTKLISYLFCTLSLSFTFISLYAHLSSILPLLKLIYFFFYPRLVYNNASSAVPLNDTMCHFYFILYTSSWICKIIMAKSRLTRIEEKSSRLY